MEVEEGLDTGGVYARDELAIGPDEHVDELRARLVEVGTRLLVETLARPGGLGRPEPQVGEPTYASKLTPEELQLDWSRPAAELARLPRVGKAWTTFRGKRLLVLDARPVRGRAGTRPARRGGRRHRGGRAGAGLRPTGGPGRPRRGRVAQRRPPPPGREVG